MRLSELINKDKSGTEKAGLQEDHGRALGFKADAALKLERNRSMTDKFCGMRICTVFK